MNYAASVQGGDHTATAVDGYSDMSGALFYDSAVYCTFTARGPSPQLQWDMLKAITGFNLTMEMWRRVNGPRIITLQKALLLLGGPDVVWDPVEDDENPPRFYEPLPSGPFKGQVTDKERVDIRTQAYYETLGWDERGIPTKETLEKLGISGVEPLMVRLRK